MTCGECASPGVGPPFEAAASADAVFRRRRVERVTGIEPAWPAWKAGALPLSYTRGARLGAKPTQVCRTGLRTRSRWALRRGATAWGHLNCLGGGEGPVGTPRNRNSARHAATRRRWSGASRSGSAQRTSLRAGQGVEPAQGVESLLCGAPRAAGAGATRRLSQEVTAGRSVVASAPALGAGDREFESPRPDERPGSCMPGRAFHQRAAIGHPRRIE